MHDNAFQKTAGSPSEKELPRFQIAFQPIVDVERRCVVAYEALTRSMTDASYPQLIASMTGRERRRFDRAICRAAIESAVRLGLPERGTSLCLNMRPDGHEAALDPEFIADAAQEFGLNANQILIELTEDHKLSQRELRLLLAKNRRLGLATGMDDFGAGNSGLTMLADVCPDVLKLDRHLVIDIENSESRQRIVAAFAEICRSMDIVLVAEGIETASACLKLRELGVVLMQGYLFARAVAGTLPIVKGFPNWSHRELREESVEGGASGWFKGDLRGYGGGALAPNGA